MSKRIESGIWSMWCTLLAIFLLLAASACGDYDKEALRIGTYRYPDQTPIQCHREALLGRPGATDDEKTKSGIRYNVRTPSNYDQTVAHPLLIVYAPGGRSRNANERFTGLTRMATGAGFLVGYADSRQLSIPVIMELGTIPKLIAKKWCVDQKRIYLTGHSDGGTVATALAFIAETKAMPTAIAPSAAGISGKEIAEYGCPEPISVMVMHNSEDTYFPGLGSEASKWWAKCNKCEQTAPKKAKNECMTYSNCANGVTTRYCEKPGSHADWPKLNEAILEFFVSISTR